MKKTYYKLTAMLMALVGMTTVANAQWYFTCQPSDDADLLDCDANCVGSCDVITYAAPCGQCVPAQWYNYCVSKSFTTTYTETPGNCKLVTHWYTADECTCNGTGVPGAPKKVTCGC